MKNTINNVGRPAESWRVRQHQITNKPKIRAFDAVAYAAALEVLG